MCSVGPIPERGHPSHRVDPMKRSVFYPESTQTRLHEYLYSDKGSQLARTQRETEAAETDNDVQTHEWYGSHPSKCVCEQVNFQDKVNKFSETRPTQSSH